MLDNFYAYIQLTRAKGTQATYKTTLRAYCRWLAGRNPAHITAPDAVAFLATRMHLSAYARRREISCLNTLYAWAITHDIVTKNPFAGIQRPKVPDGPRPFLTEEEQHRLYGVIVASGDVWANLVFSLFRYTGQRQSEILALRWGDINLEENYIQFTLRKVYRTHRMPIFSELRQLLADRNNLPWGREAHLYVCCARRGNRHGTFAYDGTHAARPDTVQRALKRFAAQAGIEKRITLHSLRHTFVTTARARGLDVEVVQKLVGHADISTTLHYNHWLEDKNLAPHLQRIFEDKNRFEK